MAVVRLKVGGRDYQVACDDGQEEHLRMLADDIDERLRSLTFSMGSNLSEPLGLLMTALTMADELVENKKENEYLNRVIQEKPAEPDVRLVEMETAMAMTLEEIALRIEKIADQIEIN